MIVDAPGNAPITTKGGGLHQAWMAFFQAIGDQVRTNTWQIGDYRQTALPASALGPNWLPCDGSDAQAATYPALAAILLPIMGPGATAGTFKTPGIVGTYTDNNPNVPLIATYIRAA